MVLFSVPILLLILVSFSSYFSFLRLIVITAITAALLFIGRLEEEGKRRKGDNERRRQRRQEMNECAWIGWPRLDSDPSRYWFPVFLPHSLLSFDVPHLTLGVVLVCHFILLPLFDHVLFCSCFSFLRIQYHGRFLLLGQAHLAWRYDENDENTVVFWRMERHRETARMRNTDLFPRACCFIFRFLSFLLFSFSLLHFLFLCFSSIIFFLFSSPLVVFLPWPILHFFALISELGVVLWFNTIQHRSSRWGTEPFLWYFLSALPRSLFPATLLLLPCGMMRWQEEEKEKANDDEGTGTNKAKWNKV